MSERPDPVGCDEIPVTPRVIEIDGTQGSRSPDIEGPKVRVINTDKTGPITPTEPSQEPSVPTAPPKRHLRPGVKFALAGIVVSVVGWFVIDAVYWIVAAYKLSLLLGILASAAAAAGVIGVGYVIVSELRNFLSLKNVEAIRQRLSCDIRRIPPSEARREIASVLAVIPKTPETEAAIANFQRQVQAHHTAAQQIEILSHTALKPLDRCAEDVVWSSAVQAFGITAVSPAALSDGLFFSACSLRMVRRIAECYGHRPGVATTAYLLRRLLIEAGTLGAAELLTSSAIQHLSGAALEHVAANAAESLYAAQRMWRLGVITMGMCRPIGFKENEAPQIASLMGHLVSGVTV